jgi:hypothetical protein
MGLRELAKADIADITSNLNEFGLAMTFTPPTGYSLEVVGTEAKIHMQFDVETGKDINAQKASVSVSEQFFIDGDYPVRDAAGRVNMKKHKVDYIDSTGTTCLFEVLEQFPDETLGLIVFILGQRKV